MAFCLSLSYAVIALFLKVSYWILIFFKNLYWICYNSTSVLWGMGSQFPDQGSNPHPCIGRQSLNHWIIREVPEFLFLIDMIPTCCPKPKKHKIVSNEKFIVLSPLIKSLSLSLVFTHITLCILFFILIISFTFMCLFYSILVYWFHNGQIPGHPVEPQV